MPAAWTWSLDRGVMFSESAQNFLENIRIPVRLACNDEKGRPRVLSLWFVLIDGDLYCATQESAQVVRFLENDPNCAYEIAADDPPYCGVRGRAIAEVQPKKGRRILKILLERYLGGTDSGLAKSLLSKSDTEVALRLRPQSVSTWNFTPRMKEFGSGEGKLCP